MNYKIIVMLSLALYTLASCHDPSKGNHDGHDHQVAEQKNKSNHDAHEGHSESITHTVYSEKTEVFVEYKPFVLNEKNTLLVHLTQLGKSFKALDDTKLEVDLDGVVVSNNKMITKGIFKINLKPNKSGEFPLKFTIKASNYSDEIIIQNVKVFESKTKAANFHYHPIEPEMVFLKEQAWNIDFANEEVIAQDFNQVIKTSGKIMPAQGDEQVIVAKSEGIIQWNQSSVLGNKVSKGNRIAKIVSSGLTHNNFNTEYQNVKSAFDKAKINYDKAVLLVNDQIISGIEFQNYKTEYFIAKTNFESLGGDNFSSSKSISSSSNGFIKNILVNNGDYVEIGQTLAIISENKNLTLKAFLPQSQFSQINEIASAQFKMSYSEEIYKTKKLISVAKTLSDGNTQLPIYFKVDNVKNIIAGSFVEVFLKGKKIENTIAIPKSSLIEEQGNYAVFIQLSGEGFEKRSIKIGLSDGKRVQVLSGLVEGERVVTKGAFQLKLASMSGEIPVHSH